MRIVAHRHRLRRSSSAPGRPSKRKIATGSVGVSGRAMNSVAPNSPSEIGEREPGRRRTRARAIGRSTSRHTRAGDAPSTAAASRRRGSIERSTGTIDAHDERDRDERLRDRDEDAWRAQVERRLVERDEEAEADRHRRHAERQHQQRVERTRRASPAARDARPTASPPTTTAITVAIDREHAASCAIASIGGTNSVLARARVAERAVERRGRARRACERPVDERRRAARPRSTAITREVRRRRRRAAPRVRAGGGRSRRAAAQPPRRCAPALRSARVTSEQRDDRDELHDGERGGERQVQQLRGLAVDLGLERRVRAGRRG